MPTHWALRVCVGATPGSRFTLSRVLKTKTKGDAGPAGPAPHGPSEDAALLTPGSMEMSSMASKEDIPSDTAQDSPNV